MVEITAAGQNKERRMKRNEDSLRDLWGNIKLTSICIIRVPERGKRENRRDRFIKPAHFLRRVHLFENLSLKGSISPLSKAGFLP